MKPSLQVRLSQHLALTPQLQQSIRLLQLSTLELHQEVEQMLEQNPFLEPDDDYSAEAAAAAAAERPVTREQTQTADAEHNDSAEAPDAAASVDSVEFGATEREDWENGTERDDFDGIRETPSNRNGAIDDDDLDPIDRAAPGISLQDHLRQQLRGMRLEPSDMAAVMVLIESLDEDGYLADPLEEIAERLAEDEEEREELLERLQCALRWLHNMEPTGVGARNLCECLSLQLRALPRSEAQIIALMICKSCLDALAKRDIKKLMAATGADEELIKQAQTLIVSLEPKPGRPFVRAEANIVVPDVIVQKSGRNWKVVLNPDVMPKLRINDLYAQAIKQQRSGDSGQALSARLQEARWFMKNIQQRFETIQRVSQAIVERQKNFFTHGEIAMKPLVLREIADELGLHESTISRVTTAKYMSTPFGTFELKYFFGSSLNTEAGGNASSTAVRALIKQLVAAEDPKKPLSDSQLSLMLEEQGIQVARRTVAKYREALKIAPANLRKSL
ncbi:RNA polymerase factor sigma-54 [Caldimonas brevitalea]|uniref:RNA polymerase sigma-54 factor n=1 Tax=Caldimonas brevitalea TaxID=413882 RepID=A0A0G3BG16_9BURK|nr:RNA polymerase factor sigma-54 [Caldimonas brevitalea]AKJ26903.1 RNA polymerase subunit sigma-54 [Caldimonas brevitalea]